MIRVAAEPDLMQAFALATRFHAELSETDLAAPMSAPKVYRALLDAANSGGLLLAGDPAIGLIALAVEPYWYSDDEFVTDRCFYVAPEARGSGAGAALLEAAKTWAEDKGLPLMLAVISGGDIEGKDHFYQRRGLARIGGVYLKGAA